MCFQNLRKWIWQLTIHCILRTTENFTIIISVLDILDDAGWVKLMRVEYTETGKAALVIPELYLAKVCRCYKHIASLGVLDYVHIFGLSLAESMRGEPVAHDVPFLFVACRRVNIMNIYWHTLCVDGLLLFLRSEVIRLFEYFRPKLSPHWCIKKNCFPLITNDHHLHAGGVHRPAWVHLDHG